MNNQFISKGSKLMQQGVFIVDEKDLNLNRTKKENIQIERAYIMNFMRFCADNFDIRNEKLYIPEDCEKYGFVEGNHSIGQMMRFFADMLEE
jgi:hypothetical protein